MKTIYTTSCNPAGGGDKMHSIGWVRPAAYAGPPANQIPSYEDGELQAVVNTPDGVFGIQPLSKTRVAADRGEHAVYRNADWVNRRGYSCAADGGQLQPEEFDGLVEPAEEIPSSPLASLAVAEIALDADHDFYVLNSRNVDATIQDMENVINGVAAIFEAQLNLTYVISSVTVRTAEPDPYTSTNPTTLLNELVTHWNAAQSSVPRDLAHLFTGKDLDSSTIGIAYIGAVCNKPWAYGLSQSRFTTSMTSRICPDRSRDRP